MERIQGIHGHNLITTAMITKNPTIQEAFDYGSLMFPQEARRFLDTLQTLPTFTPEIDEALSRLTLGLARWVTAAIEWSFRCERYFGKEAEIIRTNMMIEIPPEPIGREYHFKHDA